MSDNSEEFIPHDHGRAVVAFIDLLGFGNAVEEAVSTWEDNPVQKYNSTIEKVINTQTNFEAPDWKPPRDENIEGDKTVLAFSDCIVWNCPIKNPTAEEIGTYNDLLLRFESLAISQFQCIEQGIFVRGAVDVGFSFRMKSVFVSDALVRAARAEGSDVCYPVIAITPTLWQLMQNAAAADSHAMRDHLRIGTTEFIDKAKRTVQLRYLDYLRLVGDAQADYPGVLSTHKDQVEYALRTSPANVRNKYLWLVDYHNKFIDEHARLLAHLKITQSGIE
jgi:hypothetical protein